MMKYRPWFPDDHNGSDPARHLHEKLRDESTATTRIIAVLRTSWPSAVSVLPARARVPSLAAMATRHPVGTHRRANRMSNCGCYGSLTSVTRLAMLHIEEKRNMPKMMCGRCGCEFPSARRDAVYCSAKCRVYANREGERHQPNCLEPTVRLLKAPKKRRCGYCNRWFQPIRRNHAFCSAKCRVYFSRHGRAAHRHG